MLSKNNVSEMSRKSENYNTWPLKSKLSNLYNIHSDNNSKEMNIDNKIHNVMKKFSIKKSYCLVNKGRTEKTVFCMSLDFEEFYESKEEISSCSNSLLFQSIPRFPRSSFICYNNLPKLNKPIDKYNKKPIVLVIDLQNENEMKLIGIAELRNFTYNTNCLILNEESTISIIFYEFLTSINHLPDCYFAGKSLDYYTNCEVKENLHFNSIENYEYKNHRIVCILKHIIKTPISFRSKEDFVDQYGVLLKVNKINKKNMMNRIFAAKDIEEQIEIFIEETLLTIEEIENRQSLVKVIEGLLNQNKLNCKLIIFGSNESNSGSVESAIDVFITPKNYNSKDKINSSNEKLKVIRNIREILEIKFEFELENPIEEHKLSNVKLKADFSLIDRQLQNDGINVIFNTPELEHMQSSKLIAEFCKFETKFRILLSLILYWGKINKLIGYDKITKYAFTQMIIFFCQNLNEPLLPPIEILFEGIYKMNNKITCMLLSKWKNEQTSSNTRPIFELLKMFFAFYAAFNFRTQVICTKTGVSREKDAWNNEDEIIKLHYIRQKKSIKTRKTINGKCKIYQFKSFCCIENPLKQGFNLTAETDQSCIKNFIHCVRNINKYSENIFKKERSTKYFWGISKLICD